MIEYSTILLILFSIILLVIIYNNVSINKSIFDLMDSGSGNKESFTGVLKNFNKKFLNITNPKLESFTNSKTNDKAIFSNKLIIKKTDNYNLIFSNDKYSIWCPKSIDNYFPLGHYITKKNKKPKDFATLVYSDKNMVVKPDKFNIISITNNNYGIWKPMSDNPDFISLGNIYSKNYPSKFNVRLIHKHFLLNTDVEKMVSDNKLEKNDKGYEIWSIKNSPNFACNNRNNINEFDSLKNLYTLNNNLIDVKKKLYVKYTLSYKKIISYNDTKLNKHFTVWRPIPPKNFYSLGDVVLKKGVNPNNLLETIVVHKSFCKFPLNYGLTPVITFKVNDKPYSVWKPTAHENHHFLGQVVSKGTEEPVDEELIACIPVDYLDKTNTNNMNMIWNNLNEENPTSIWMNYLNLLSANNRYSAPDNNGIMIIKNLTTSDIDLMDNSKTIYFNYRKNNKHQQPFNEILLKNLVKMNLSRKFDIDEDRLVIDNINTKKREVTITILSRKINKNSITIDEFIKNFNNSLKIGDIKIYTEDKNDHIITIENGGIINKNLNEIIIDNSDYRLSFTK